MPKSTTPNTLHGPDQEVSETELHSNNKNREDDLVFSRPWKQFIHSLKEWMKPSHKDRPCTPLWPFSGPNNSMIYPIIVTPYNFLWLHLLHPTSTYPLHPHTAQFLFCTGHLTSVCSTTTHKVSYSCYPYLQYIPILPTWSLFFECRFLRHG